MIGVSGAPLALLLIQAPAGGEQFVTLWQNASVKIERIVSHSHRSPENFWYDQGEDEWVIVLRGTATLEFASGELVELRDGDHLMIPRHLRHRVARTGACPSSCTAAVPSS